MKKTRATITTNKGEFYKWLIFCPGCKCIHGMNAGWSFNGDLERPTFKPSIRVRGTDWDGKVPGKGIKKTVCHSFVTDGRIKFLDDSTHELAGQTVDLPDEFSHDWDDRFDAGGYPR